MFVSLLRLRFGFLRALSLSLAATEREGKGNANTVRRYVE